MCLISFSRRDPEGGSREAEVSASRPKKLYLDSKDVLVNRPKKTIPQNAAQANKGVTLSTLPEYATPNEWAEAFNVSLRTVYRMCSLGELMTVKVRGNILIYRDSSFVLLGLDR